MVLLLDASTIGGVSEKLQKKMNPSTRICYCLTRCDYTNDCEMKYIQFHNNNMYFGRKSANRAFENKRRVKQKMLANQNTQGVPRA
jgi:hypothetical protein